MAILEGEILPPQREPLPEKTISRSLDGGKWKIGVDPGWDVLGVNLIGLRARPWPLMPIDHKTFCDYVKPEPGTSRFPDRPLTVQGIPVGYLHYGHIVHLWPVPRHQWKIEIKLRKREKKHAD